METPNLAILHDRLTLLETREAIRDLLTRYGIAADCGDADSWARCWAMDGIYEREGKVIATSRAQIRAMFEDPNAVHKQEIEGMGSAHAVGPLDIDIDGDAATVRGVSVVLTNAGTGYAVHSLSHNRWHLHRGAEGWQIARRVSRKVAPRAGHLVY